MDKVDKYEYNLKLEEIDKLVDQGDYEEAAKLADTIEWRKVRNVRTLCLISEIYEAAGRLDRSKEMLERAYNRSSVGRTVLYRLVEVTTALGQYDEALEYYSEYVQAAPHDNNRYVLKYMIYKGRGSAPQDLIPILEEYLRQEYTERWAYELATVYQQAGQIQKCLATCDDLVLWFHSGKYVKKALELKKRYAVLTPKQQQIYEVCMQEEAQSDYFEDSDEETTLAQPSSEADEEVIAENIIAQTEKEIAGEITARKAEKEKQEQPAGSAAVQSVPNGAELRSSGAAGGSLGQSGSAGTAAHGEVPSGSASNAGVRQNGGMAAAALAPEPDLAEAFSDEPDISEGSDYEGLQVELAKSVRKVISGVARKPEMDEDDVPAAVEEQLRPVQEVSRRKEPEPTVGKLSIDDILLSMGEKGRQAAAAARAQREEAAQSAAASEASPVQDAAVQPSERPMQEAAVQPSERPEQDAAVQPSERPEQDAVVQSSERPVRDEVAQSAEHPTEEAAVQSATHLAEDTGTQPATAERLAKEAAEAQPAAPLADEPHSTGSNAAQSTVRPAESTEPQSAARLAEGTGSQPSARPAESTEPQPAARPGGKAAPARTIAAAAAEELTEGQREALRYSSNPEKLMRNRGALPAYAQDQNLGATRRIVNPKEDLLEAARQEMMASKTIRIPAEEISRAYAHGSTWSGDANEAVMAQRETASTAEVEPGSQKRSQRQEDNMADRDAAQSNQAQRNMAKNQPEGAYPGKAPEDQPESAYDGPGENMEDRTGEACPGDQVEDPSGDTYSGTSELDGSGEGEEEYEEYYDDPLTIEPHLRGFFKGFTEIGGLEDQVANAILQALAKGTDRTSRTGNLLIFGAHGSGKTTLAVAIARAIAQEKGQKSAKMAKIYAADLNRRDIAATIAKIAGGILIVEEAGDLNDNTVEQMTTAMEFRTDGLIVILEDEQRYVHDLLMKHPRFTMKFTAQIYLPVYTADELQMFARCHANELDYSISEDGYEAIAQKIAAAAAGETPMSVTDVVALVDKAIRHSNKFMRKMSMGKKRYDENDYVVLFAKDFK